MKRIRRISLTKGLLVIVLMCWIIPITVFAGSLTMKYNDSITGKIEVLMEEELKNFTTLVGIHIDEAISLSKQISYDKLIEYGWWRRQQGLMGDTEFYRVVIAGLRSRFFYDRRFEMSAFFLADNPDYIYLLSPPEDPNQEEYRSEIHSEVKKITSMDDSYAHVLIYKDRVFIVRNVYTTTQYLKIGTLVVEMNKSLLFSGASRSEHSKLILYTGGDSLQSVEVDDQKGGGSEEKTLQKQLEGDYSTMKDDTMDSRQYGTMQGFIYQHKAREYHLATMLLVDKRDAYSELEGLRRLMYLLGLILIPLIAYMIYFNYRHISRPVHQLADAFQNLEKGRLGVQMTGTRMPNIEFEKLQNSFNNMSAELQNLFDYAYQEKLARKDASIIALQSQLNPHFLNNTLEMMNWQARMAGDVTVSKMIEALGTLLDYSMDRRGRRLISIAEELRCADAYLYILSMRFGQRLKVEKEYDQSLLQNNVPRLILQPLLENAVKHGIEKNNQGTIRMQIFKEDRYIVLQVKNTGNVISKEEEEKIKKILTEPLRQEEREKMNRVSLGIRNVNDRIQLIYGKNYGLIIEGIEDGYTVSTVRLPADQREKNEKEVNIKSMWNENKDIDVNK